MHAARNIHLCTKDCVCLFVCPTGATDTETGQIDFARCIDGCRLCVDACPSHAIYLVYDRYPVKPEKDQHVVAALDALAESKVQQQMICSSLGSNGELPEKLAKALALSNRILAEDCTREADFMVPQTLAVKSLLTDFVSLKDREGFPAEALEALIKQFV
jgi:Fe-S-cluster-containing hydrogenase component 2